MQKEKRIDELYRLSPFRWFIRAGTPLFLVLTGIIVLVFCALPFIMEDKTAYSVEEISGIFIGLLAFMAIISYVYPLIGIVKLRKQEFIIHKRYKDRMHNGVEQAKKEWFVSASGARLIIYHRDYIESIVKEVKEDRSNQTSSVTVYLLYIKNCNGHQEKITFLFKSDVNDFRRWLGR